MFNLAESTTVTYLEYLLGIRSSVVHRIGPPDHPLPAPQDVDGAPKPTASKQRRLLHCVV